MNRQRYQLVFNRHRGMLMAVAETASAISGQKLPTVGGGVSVVAPASWKFCTLVCTLALTWQSLAHAQILVDRNAPREEQPMVLKAANGVPVVNIRQPNAKGLSVNSYRRFDVDGRGVILNNAGNSSKSELGGYIAGNPWMPGGGAQVIVNQVNATDPSYLRGFIEVAGNPAQVIIANPAGITCVGCGFINAQRATMTTGTPVIRQGNLESYRVNSGVISFEGLGLQANDTAYADVIARAVRVHAALRARQIRLTTGLNTVSADHAQVTPGQSATDGAPVRAIDVAALGGMYAGHIYLAATEHGVGVHNGGTLTATEGQLVVTAAGRLENTGTLAAHGDTRIAAAGAVTNSGVIGSDSTLQINADALENTARGRIGSVSGTSVQIGGTLRNTGSIVGDAGITLAAAAMENAGSVVTPGALALRIRNMLDNSGKLFSHGSLFMRIGAAALNSGKIGADGTVDFRAASLANGGALYSLAKSVDVQTRESITNSGTVEAKQSVSLKAATLNNSGTFTAEGAMKLSLQQGLSNTGEIGANDTLTVNAATLENRGRIRSAESSLVLATDGKTSNQGKILAATRLEITATGIDNSDGTLAGNEVVIDTRKQRFNNQRGVLFARQDVKLESAELDNRAGSIAARGKLRLSSGAINNERGQLQSKGAMQVEVSAGEMDNRRGLIRSDEDVTLQSQSLRNDDTQGKDQGIEGRSVSLTTDALHNDKGAVRTGQSLQIAARDRVDNRGGLLSSQGTLSVSDPASTRRLVIDNEGGRILAGGDLSLTSDSLIGKGLLLSHKDLRIDVTADLEHRGETAAAGNLDLRIGGRFSNYGTLAAGAALRVTAKGLQNHAGASILGGDVSLSAGAGQDFINRGLIDGVTTRIQAGTLYNLGTGRIYGDRIALAADVLHNAPESVDGALRAPVIAARERLDIGTGLLYNSERALLYSVGDMSIGGAIGSDHRATGRAREVNNTSATVNADGALTVAADAINNRNAHVEIAEESKPGRRIINYRLVGSPEFVSGDNARLIHQDSGQIIAPENWRAMGDEDNFRLLLPSEEYPFERYGPPFDYSRYVPRRDTSGSGVGVTARARMAVCQRCHLWSSVPVKVHQARPAAESAAVSSRSPMRSSSRR